MMTVNIRALLSRLCSNLQNMNECVCSAYVLKQGSHRQNCAPSKLVGIIVLS